MADLEGRRILLGVCGGIAAYKTAPLIRLLKKAGAEVQLMMTKDASRFVTPLTLGTLAESEVLTEIFPENEAGSWTKHVQLGLWADLFVVAPATAQTIAKLAGGFCDSMLTAVALSARCPLLVCPAMDHDMYEHPATQRNLAQLRRDGHLVMEAEEGELASGLVGKGRLPEPETIFERIQDELGERDSWAGRRVLVTAGPTREPVDPVRFFSNPSTGTMGYALARAARRRGAEVTLVSGPTQLEAPEGVRRVDVQTARQMRDAVSERADADLVIMAAAVADYAPAETHEQKRKKGKGDWSIRMERTPDILAGLGERKREGQLLVGFALETNDGEQNAREKLERKNLDWIALNLASEAGSGFGRGTNRVTLLGRDGSRHEIPTMEKSAVAEAILDHLDAALR